MVMVGLRNGQGQLHAWYTRRTLPWVLRKQCTYALGLPGAILKEWANSCDVDTRDGQDVNWHGSGENNKSVPRTSKDTNLGRASGG